MIENSMGHGFLMIEEFDGLFPKRAFLIERECVYSKEFRWSWNFIGNVQEFLSAKVDDSESPKNTV